MSGFQEMDERRRLLREYPSFSDADRRDYEALRTDYHAVLEDLRVFLAGYVQDYEVQGRTAADFMLVGPVHGRRVHVRVDIEEVLN